MNFLITKVIDQLFGYRLLSSSLASARTRVLSVLIFRYGRLNITSLLLKSDFPTRIKFSLHLISSSALLIFVRIFRSNWFISRCLTQKLLRVSKSLLTRIGVTSRNRRFNPLIFYVMTAPNAHYSISQNSLETETLISRL